MTSFPLKIVTPDGLIFDGQAEEVVVRSTSGDLYRHDRRETALCRLYRQYDLRGKRQSDTGSYHL